MTAGPGRDNLIERATLIKIARETAARRMAERPSLLSAYLIGSVAADEPLLGQATDIDLVLIDIDPPVTPREVIRLTDQVVLDIHHRARDEYANPKSLRLHPWLGPELAEPIFLADPRHFFELAQSSARGQFYRAEYVAARARTFLAWARAALHIGLLPGAEPEAPVSLADFGGYPLADCIDPLRRVDAGFGYLRARSFGNLCFLAGDVARENSKGLGKILLRPTLRVRQIARRDQTGIVDVEFVLLAGRQLELGRQLGLVRFGTRWNGRPAQILLRLSL